MKKRSGENHMALAGKSAVVTGASRGIGLAIAEELASRGCSVIVVARSAARLRAAEKKIAAAGGKVLPHACDVTNEKSVVELFRFVKEKFRKLDILVNNAGIAGPLADIEKTTLTQWREIMATNVEGTFSCTRAALPLMTRGSTIVNNLSIAAKQAFPEMAAYVASKHAALGFTNVLRQELREREIRVLALLPG